MLTTFLSAILCLLLCNFGANGAATRSQVVVDPAFISAGQQQGLEIWRIENFKPVAVPKNQHGVFYSGDSYIILNTIITKKGAKSYDLHFWLGEDTSQDEAGSAAILTVQLDDYLKGIPVEHRETQGHESSQFSSYFKGGIRYQSGGVSSGFNHVDRNRAAETRLFQVKGNKNVRVKQVDPNLSSLNNGDCYILDTGRNIYVYVGTNSRRVEKLKATAAANQIRDQDHSGRPKVVLVDEYSPQSDFDEFFAALGGGGARGKVPEQSVGGDDASFEYQDEQAVSIHKVSDASGSIKIEQITRRPFESSLLDSNDVFIVDSGSGDVFVWIGKKATATEKREALAKGETYLKSHKRPSWSHVQRVVQGSEPAALTQLFKTWQGYGESRSRLV